VIDIEAISRALLDAEARRTPLEPLTTTNADFKVEHAYQVQLAAGVRAKVAGGRRVIGKKIGLTSKAMQDMFGVQSPDYGHLLDDMLLFEGQPCRRGELLLPKVEGEVAFVMERRLQGPGVNVADVLRATAGVMPALEIVDSRIRDWKIKLPDTVADNASSARLVVGSRLLPARDFDLRLIGMCLAKNGVVVNSGAGVAVWGHPAAAVAWLANKLSEFGGALEPGEIVLSGAVTAAVDVAVGDTVQAEFDRLGSVSVKFA
jgi:2-keto-4-pentenoate hydratase